MIIRIKRNTNIFGPYTVEEARGYLVSGQLLSSDFAQIEGTSEWIPLLSVPGVRSAPPPPLEGGLPSSAADEKIQFGLVIRDVAIVFVLTFIGGLVVGLTGVRAEMSSVGFVLAVAASNLLLGTVGFVIVGCLAKGTRWRHLSYVAFGVWLTGLINVASGVTTIPQWFLGAFFVAIIMGVGGGLSFVFKRAN